MEKGDKASSSPRRRQPRRAGEKDDPKGGNREINTWICHPQQKGEGAGRDLYDPQSGSKGFGWLSNSEKIVPSRSGSFQGTT